MCIKHKMLKSCLNKFSLFALFFFLIVNNSYSEIIKKIEISGNDRIPDETIKMLTNIRVNDDISQSDINNLIKAGFQSIEKNSSNGYKSANWYDQNFITKDFLNASN